MLESLARLNVSDLTSRREKRTFSQLSLVAEISRYLNRSPLEIEDLLGPRARLALA